MSAWLAGIVLSRVVIEVGPTNADATAWNRMASEAILAVMLGEVPVVETSVDPSLSSAAGPTRS